MTFASQPADLLSQLAEISADSELARARETRQAATAHTRGSYLAIFAPADDAGFSRSERLQLAERISEWHGDSRLAKHYAEQLGAQARKPVTTRLQAAFNHAERLTFTPASATPEHLQALQQADWSLDAIVTLSQLIAFVSFQSRLLRGYRLIGGKPTDNDSEIPVGAAFWRTEPATHQGRKAPQAFTQDELSWEPWIAAKPLEKFDAAQQETLARFGHSDSDYFRLLGRDITVLEQRTLTDKGIFYTPGGLPRKDRELAAAVASKVNGCIYCASVHARKAAQLSKQPDDVQRLLDVKPGGILSQGQPERWKTQIDFAASLSATPASASPAQIARLRAQGLTDLQLLDLVQSTAFFAWANRLMLTLGEPVDE